MYTKEDLPAFLAQRQADVAKALRQGAASISPDIAYSLRNSVSLLSPASCLLALPCNSPGVDPIVDDTKMSVTMPISTNSVDRMGDIVEPKGCVPHLANYTRNPRVFFSHKQNEMPIGSARNPDDGSLALSIQDNCITSTCYFHGETAESEVIFRLVKRKELQAASIGFLPVKAALLKKKEKSKEAAKTEEGERIIDMDPFLALRFLEWDLTEWSIVPIPANADACASLTIHLEKGHIEGERIPLSIQRSLEPFKLKARIWSPGFNPESSKFSGILSLGEREVEYDQGKMVRFDSFSYPKEGEEEEKPTDNGMSLAPQSFPEGTTIMLPGIGLEVDEEAQVTKELQDTDNGMSVEQEPTEDEEKELEPEVAKSLEVDPPVLQTPESPVVNDNVVAAVEAAVLKALTPELLSKALSGMDESAGGALVGNGSDKDKQTTGDCSAEVLQLVKSTLELLTQHIKDDTREHKEIMAVLDKLMEAEKQEAQKQLRESATAQKALIAGMTQFNELMSSKMERLTGRRS